MTTSSSKALARQVVEWAISKKAEDVVLMDLTGLFDVTDHFVVATGLSEIQVEAIVEAILEGAKAAGHVPLHVEGKSRARWTLIDFVDVVVHVMVAEERLKYDLERLWGDAPLTRFDEDGSELGAPASTASEEGEGA